MPRWQFSLRRMVLLLTMLGIVIGLVRGIFVESEPIGLLCAVGLLLLTFGQVIVVCR